MKTLKIYKQDGEFVIERVNEFNHATKRFFITEEGLKEGIEVYGAVLADYQLEVSDELWALVVNFVGFSEFGGAVSCEALCPCCEKAYIVFKADLDFHELELYSQEGYTVKPCKECKP